jgi:hypothetical protein
MSPNVKDCMVVGLGRQDIKSKSRANDLGQHARRRDTFWLSQIRRAEPAWSHESFLLLGNWLLRL